MGVQGRLGIYLLTDVLLHQLCLNFVLLNQESKIISYQEVAGGRMVKKERGVSI